MWPREIVEPVVISAGLPLVLSCDPPAGPPKPETHWMSSCRCLSFKSADAHEPGILLLSSYTQTPSVSPGSYARPFNWPIQTAFPTMQPVRQDRRVSMGINGDLYFSNVLFNDSVSDYCCNTRFPYKNVIQQKMPVVVKVLTSAYDSATHVFTRSFPGCNSGHPRSFSCNHGVFHASQTSESVTCLFW